jgi:hypothetical protein
MSKRSLALRNRPDFDRDRFVEGGLKWASSHVNGVSVNLPKRLHEFSPFSLNAAVDAYRMFGAHRVTPEFLNATDQEIVTCSGFASLSFGVGGLFAG